MTTFTEPPSLPQHATRTRRMVGVLGAVGSALLIYALARLAGLHLRQLAFGAGVARPLSPAAVAAAAAVGSLLGWMLLAALERLSTRAARIWMIAAPVSPLLSLSAPLSGHGVSVSKPSDAGADARGGAYGRDLALPRPL